MKLAKLSLAAIMTVGAMSTVSAGSLEEAIKGVDLSGFARYRFNDMERDNAIDNTRTNDYDISIRVTSPVTDNLKFTAALTAGGGLNDSDAQVDGSGGTAAAVGKMWFTYAQDALTVKAGRMALGTPVTDNGYRGQKGTGVLALYNAGAVTFAGAHYNTSNANDWVGVPIGEISALAVIGSYGPVNVQLWGITADRSVDSLIFAQADGEVAGVNLKAQVINTKLDVASPTEDTGMFYAVQAGYAMDNFELNAGYTNNDEDQSVHALDTDNNTDVISGGWRLNSDFDGTRSGGNQYFVDGSVSFGKVGIVLGYAKAEIERGATNPLGALAEEDASEIWGGVSYKYAKNFNTYIRYSDINADATNAEILEQQFLRFEARYSF